jgi:hypothetical protein
MQDTTSQSHPHALSLLPPFPTPRAWKHQPPLCPLQYTDATPPPSPVPQTNLLFLLSPFMRMILTHARHQPILMHTHGGWGTDPLSNVDLAHDAAQAHPFPTMSPPHLSSSVHTWLSLRQGSHQGKDSSCTQDSASFHVPRLWHCPVPIYSPCKRPIHQK